MSSFSLTLINKAQKATAKKLGITPSEVAKTARLMYYYKSCQASKINEDMDLYALGYSRVANAGNLGGLYIKPTVLWHNYHKFGHISDELYKRGLELMKPFFENDYEQSPYLKNIAKDECKKVKIQ